MRHSQFEPKVQWDVIWIDALVLCVDRHSGWTIAMPTQRVGLTAEKVARFMVDKWEGMGVPSLVTSDMGPQFIGQWWRTLCARLGIRVAYSQGYHHQANGRAEVVGKVLWGIIRKLNAESRVNWVEALPRILRIYHDMENASGLSPYQMVFGRERAVAGLPYTPPKMCEGAQSFFDRMDMIDREVARVLNTTHFKKQEWFNKGRSEGKVYAVGDKVWVLRPREVASEGKFKTW